ncbi:MAG: DinB family protein [Planctomycetota bacterium]
MPSPNSFPMTRPISVIARFRHLYDYERDCNAKVIRMLESVPAAARTSAQFTRAVGKAAHLVAARHMWLHRLGICQNKPADWFPPTTLEELPAATAAVESLWVTYLASLSDEDTYNDVQWMGFDGKRRRWPLMDLLTQIFGHAWYHRGQVAMLVKDLGGEPIDCDYIFWNRPTVIDELA